MTHPRSLRRDIVGSYSVILLLALTIFACIAYAILRTSLQRAGTQSLRQTAYAAEQLIAPPGIPRIATHEVRLPPGPGAVEAMRRSTRLATGEELNIYVARTGDVENHALHSFALIAFFLIPLTALAAALVGRTVADRTLQPLNRLVAASREIGIAGLARRVDEPESPTELRELAQSFNEMLGRLERAVEALRQFTADASHELRTPLTAIRGSLQVALARPRGPEGCARRWRRCWTRPAPCWRWWRTCSPWPAGTSPRREHRRRPWTWPRSCATSRTSVRHSRTASRSGWSWRHRPPWSCADPPAACAGCSSTWCPTR
jgi:signal transduction histidine kinase